MTSKMESKNKATKVAANAASKPKDLATKKSPKGGDGSYWGKMPNHNGSLLRVM